MAKHILPLSGKKRPANRVREEENKRPTARWNGAEKHSYLRQENCLFHSCFKSAVCVWTMRRQNFVHNAIEHAPIRYPASFSSVCAYADYIAHQTQQNGKVPGVFSFAGIVWAATHSGGALAHLSIELIVVFGHPFKIAVISCLCVHFLLSQGILHRLLSSCLSHAGFALNARRVRVS